MAKLPIKVHKRLTSIQEERIPHFYKRVNELSEEFLKDDTNLGIYGKLRYFEGLLAGCYTTIEDMLHDYNCYRGFGEWKAGYREYLF